MTEPYLVLRTGVIGGNTRRGMVLDLEAMRGEPLSKLGYALKLSPKEAGRAERVPGAIPCFADAELHKILVDRGLEQPAPGEKVTKTSFLRR